MSKRSARNGLVLGAVALFLTACLAVPAQAAQAVSGPSSFVHVGGETSVPFGWADFCRRYKGECEAGAAPGPEVAATSIDDVRRINRWVNAHVAALSDADHWGVADRWDYPADEKGDCEDYALLKRKLLMEAGFPRRSVLLTIVKDGRNDGHAVLMVKIKDSELILDNLTNELKPWDQTGYRFVKRQSEDDPNIWVQLGDPTPAPDYVSR